MQERLAKVVEAWELELGEVLGGGWNSFVAAVRAGGSAAVLKLPADPTAVAAEAAALEWWGPDVAPRVLRRDDALGALLLERLEPGTELPWTAAADTEAFVPLLRAMQRPVGGEPLPLPRLADSGADVLDTLARNLERNRDLVGETVVQRAGDLLGALFATSDDQVVLHGDAVPANVLRSGERWRVIDPRPCLGERAYDAGYWAVFSGYGREAGPNVALLARELDLDERRVLSWAWALAVNRLLQIVDSTYHGHRTLVAELERFIAETRLPT